MNELTKTTPEKSPTEVKNLADFDLKYFQELEGEDGWLALGHDDYQNQKYFTVLGANGEKLGIVGVFDTDKEKNITHTVVDPNFRGLGLAAKFKEILMDKLNLPYITLTINLDNTSSIKAAEKLPGIAKASDEQYENDFGKVKYIYKRQKIAS